MRALVRVGGVGLVSLGLVACARGDEAVGRDPSGSKATVTASAGSGAGSSTASSVAVSGGSASTVASTVASGAAVALPPIDARCTTEVDCGYAFAYLVDGKCCRGTCSPEPASTSHLAKVEAMCAKLGYAEEHCPMKKCKAPAPLDCVAGRCVVRSP